MKKLLIGLMALLILSGCAHDNSDNPASPTETAPDAAQQTEPYAAEKTEHPEEPAGITYISVGDSIARGYGLSDIQNTRYSGRIRDLYGDDGMECSEKNYGVDGQTSTELISYAAGLNLADADIITISIGANNILGPAFDFLNAYRDYASNPDTAWTEKTIAEKYNSFLSRADEGILTLETDIPVLIETIRKQNDDCEILFLTVYNPYAAVEYTLYINGFPIDFAALSGSYVTRLSEVIENGADANGYTTADIRAAFDGKEANLVCAGAATEENIGSLDPHPNDKGHNVIAKTLYELMNPGT